MNNAAFDYGQQYQQPQHVPSRQAPSGPNGWMVIVIVLVLLFGAREFGFIAFNIPDRGGQQQQLDNNDDKQSDNLEFNSGWLVIVEETKGRPDDRQIVLDSMHALLPDDIEYWRRDPDSPDAETFMERAAKEGVSPPFVMLVNPDGDMIRVSEFPADKTSLGSFLNK